MQVPSAPRPLALLVAATLCIGSTSMFGRPAHAAPDPIPAPSANASDARSSSGMASGARPRTNSVPTNDLLRDFHGSRASDPSDPLTAYVVTFSPGDHPFYKFGHNAIWIHDERKAAAGRDRVYNYGTFAFGDPALIPKFFLGRFLYWLSSQSIQTTILTYRAEGRSIEVQELDLDKAQKAELQRLLEDNLRPENKHYKYDYYRDNCATRVRDMVDRVIGGRLHAATTGPARLTYRQHTQRLTADLPPEYVVLDLMMGDFIDQPITEWDEGFLPMEVQRSLRKVTIAGPDGAERPLVKSEKVLLAADRIAPPSDPPRAWPYGLLAGLGLGGMFAALGRIGARTQSIEAATSGGAGAPFARPARVVFGVLLALVGFVVGFIGIGSTLAWAVTDHAVTYRNENLLLAVPWAMILSVTGINVARARVASMLRAERLLLVTLGASALAIVCKLLPWFDQDNRLFLAFFPPLWAGAFYGARALANTARGALEQSGALAKSRAVATSGAEAKPEAREPSEPLAESGPRATSASTEPSAAAEGEAREASDS